MSHKNKCMLYDALNLVITLMNYLFFTEIEILKSNFFILLHSVY